VTSPATETNILCVEEEDQDFVIDQELFIDKPVNVAKKQEPKPLMRENRLDLRISVELNTTLM
jgi:hypothetical protein